MRRSFVTGRFPARLDLDGKLVAQQPQLAQAEGQPAGLPSALQTFWNRGFGHSSSFRGVGEPRGLAPRQCDGSQSAAGQGTRDEKRRAS